MSPFQQDDQEVFVPCEYPLSAELYSYLAVLVQRAPGNILFRTGAGRIFRDLLVHWPTLEDWENEAQDMCQRISDAAYPLASALYAQAVEITIKISQAPLTPPSRVDALSTSILFDADKRVERHVFLSPHQALPDADLLSAAKGVSIICRPLNYRYHTIKDDRKRIGHPHAGIFELSERLNNTMLYEQPDFVPREKVILAAVKADIKALPRILERAEESRNANLAVEPRHLSHAAPVIAAVTSISALPPPVRALERRLLNYVTDKTLSPDLRLALRKTAQQLRAFYPQAGIEEAARMETARPVVKGASLMVQPAPQQQAAYQANTQPILAPQIRTQKATPPKTAPTFSFTPRTAAAQTSLALRISAQPLSLRRSVLLPVVPSFRHPILSARTTAPLATRRVPTSQPRLTPQQSLRKESSSARQPTPEARPAAQPTTAQRGAQPTQHVEPAPRVQLAEQPRTTASPQRTAQPTQRAEPSPKPQQTEQPRATASPQRSTQPTPEARPISQSSTKQRTTQPTPEARPVSQPAQRAETIASPRAEPYRPTPAQQTSQPEARATYQPAAAQRTAQLTQRAEPSPKPQQTEQPRTTTSPQRSTQPTPEARPISQSSTVQQTIQPTPEARAIHQPAAMQHSPQPAQRFEPAPRAQSAEQPRATASPQHSSQPTPEVRPVSHPTPGAQAEQTRTIGAPQQPEIRPSTSYKEAARLESRPVHQSRFTEPEAKFSKTSSEPKNTASSFFPKYTPVAPVGKLARTVSLSPVPSAFPAQKAAAKARLWAATFPTPTPMPLPHSPVFKGRK